MNEKEKSSKKKIILISVAAVVLVAAVIAAAVWYFSISKNNKTEETTVPESQEQQSEEETVEVKQAPLDDEDDPLKADALTETDDEVVNKAAEAKVITYGIDVSKYQGIIDWEEVAADGVKFAIIRVGYRTVKSGEICEDPYAKYNLAGAIDAGIQVGVYFFSSAINEAEAVEEARWLTSTIADYGITYPVIYNSEGFLDQDNRMYGLTNEERTNNACAFLDYVKDQGYTPMFYASKNELKNSAYWDTEKLEGAYDIWLSQYISTDYSETIKPDYDGEYQMWQYTSTGTVSGISGNVDMNVAYFGFSEAKASKSGNTYEKVSVDPEIGINFTEVSETVTAKDVTNLRIYPMKSDGSTVVKALNNGETVTRTGIGDNGWSRVTYNGQTLYAYSEYLTTELSQSAETTSQTQQSSEEDKGVGASDENGNIYKYTQVNELVTAKISTNLRDYPSTDSDSNVIVTINNGETVLRVGIGNNNGWSKVEYNGQVLYAVTSYLTTDIDGSSATVAEQTEAETETADYDLLKFTEVNETVTAKVETNLRSFPSTDENSQVVATIKNGETVTRTGIGSNNGWSRVEYNGQVLYAVTSYLTTEIE